MKPEVVRQVLVATDFSETSEVAVRAAHAYARAFGHDCTPYTSAPGHGEEPRVLPLTTDN
jgi:nucleotide-binding universal stress UspA family protein